MEFKPHAYQQYMIDEIVKRKHVGAFLEMGLGKTVITLTAVTRLLDDFYVDKVLVIAPLRVAQAVWAQEAQKWDHTKHLRVSKILGSHSERVAAAEADADVYLINRENVSWLVSEYGLKKWKWDMVVIDELSSFKNGSSNRFRALRRVLPHAQRVVGLTGTPAPNGLIDLWSQIYLLDQGEALGRTATSYRDAFFTPKQRSGYVVYNWQLKPGAEEEIHRRLQSVCVSMRACDHLQMPDLVMHEVPVVLEDTAAVYYRDMERDYLVKLAEEEITAANAAVVAGKLMQMTGGACYTEGGRYEEMSKAKLDALEEIVESAQGKPVLVYYQYQHELPRLMKRFPKARQLRTDADVVLWNEGKVPIMLAHPASAGHGLNLQHGGHIMVWYSLTWNLEHYQQANARLWRQGQREPVIVHHLIAKGTVDERVMRVLHGKARLQDELMAAVDSLR